MEQLNEAVDKFTETIHQYKPYSIQDAYSDFVGRYYELLSKIEDYFVDASPTAVLGLVDDTMYKIMCAEMEHEKKEQELCKDPRVSTDNIMQPHKVMNRLETMPNFKKFEGGEQFAISELFRHPQCTHNASSEMASHLAFLARTLQPTQFEYILKHSIRPLVQLHLCNPGELHFAKSDLSSKEALKQRAVNTILPHLYHPNLDGVESKHATRCLAAAVHYTLRQKHFNKFHESQATVADMFLVERKKFFSSVTGRTYNAGKKLTKAKKKEKEVKELELKKQKLKGQTPKELKQEKEKEEPAKVNTTMEGGEDMPMLISNDEQDSPGQGMKKKRFIGKKPTGLKPPHK